MIITRIGSIRKEEIHTDRVELVLNYNENVRYVITDYYSEGLRVHVQSDNSEIIVKPGCANEIIVIGK